MTPLPKPRAGEHTGPIRYVRAPEYDRRIKNGDDFAGDAYVRWVAVGHTPEQPETLEAERDQLRAREAELVEALEKSADTFRDLVGVLQLLGRPVSAQACEIAEQGTRAALSKVRGA